MKINWEIKKIEELSAIEMYEILYERSLVFVVEQQCIYQDIDKWDKCSWHIIGKDENGNLAAYARVIYKNTKMDKPIIGRVVVSKNYRKKGLGHLLLEKCISKCNEEYQNDTIFLAAQYRLIAFYEDLGFKAISEVYDDDGIDHINMELSR